HRGGLVTEEDLARYEPTTYEGGISVDYRGHTVVGVPGACGGITALQSLNLLERFDLAAHPADALETVHLHAEVYRRAFADRHQLVADPKQAQVPWNGLLSKRYAAARAAEIDPTRAAVTVAPGDPWAFEVAPDRSALAGLAHGGSDTSTTHVNAVDSD